MNVKELAEKLHGCQIGNEISDEIEQEAKVNNMVIVFGASDDLMELRGAIDEELDAYKGGIAYVNSNGLLLNECDNDACPCFERRKKAAKQIKQIWLKEKGLSWSYETEIPHKTFDVIEDDGVYCRGIVFWLGDAC